MTSILHALFSTEEAERHQPKARTTKAYNRRDLEKSVGYSQAVLANGQLFISGCVSWDLEGNPLHVGDFESQVKEIYSDINATLKAHGMDAGDIVKETLYTTDMEALITANTKRKEYYQSVMPPASTWVEVRRLVRPELLLEIEVIALKRQ